MNPINSAHTLRAAIIELEQKQDQERAMLNEQLCDAFEELKPINLIKNTLKEVAASASIKNNILNTAVGLAAGYLGKRVYVGTSTSIYKRLVGNALMYGITNLVSRHPDIVLSVQKVVISLVNRGIESQGQTEEEVDSNFSG